MYLTSFDCIKRVIGTSKSRQLIKKHGQFVFEVHPDANKPMIKKAVEGLWAGAKVTKIAVITVPGRQKKVKRGHASVLVGGYKKAIVTISGGMAATAGGVVPTVGPVSP